MKKHFGLMFVTGAIAIGCASSFAQTPTIAVTAPRVAAPTATVATTIATPVVSPAVLTTVAQPTVAVAVPQAVPPPPPAAPTPAAPPAPPAPATAVTAPAVAPAAPAPPAPPAIAQEPPPQKPPAPPATPKPAAAPRPPEPPLAIEPPGRERIDPDPVNIRFEVSITNQTGTSAPIKRMAVLTVANNTGDFFGRASLRSGNNVPVPTTTLTSRSEDGKETPVAKPLTSYNYRSVGLNVDVQRAAIVPGNRVRATLNVEFSGVDERTGPGSGGAAPSFPTFSQGIGLYLDSGKPVLVAQSSDIVDNVERKQTVEVKATILR